MANVYGTNGNDTLFGFNNSNDAIYGYNGNDNLYGLSGNDRLVGGNGSNNLWGGSGYDWFSMSSRTSAGFSSDVIRDFQFDVDKIDVSAWGISDFSQIQALLVNGSAGATLNAYYAGYSHFITVSNVAANQLISSDFVYSNAGPKSEGGTNYADVMFGSRYNDVLFGYGGNDRILGGIGNDTLSGGLGADLINGGVGTDTATHTTATTGVVADLLSPSANTGEAAGDVYQSVENLGGSNYADSLRGNDLANGLYGYGGNDLIYGRGGNDVLAGGAGNDYLSGNVGNDTLSGEVGSDQIEGGTGTDRLYGGADNDRFIFRAISDSFPGATRDVIFDLDDAGNDFIDLSLMPGVTSFIGTAAFSAPGQVRAIQAGAHVLVQINTAGASGAESEILVANSSLGFGAGQVWSDDFLL